MNQGVKIVICRAKRLRWYPNPFTTHPTREMIILVKLVFTAATLCFVLGYANRFRNNPLHQRLMISGFLLTLAIAVVLVVGVYGFGESYAAAGWLVRLTGSEQGARIVLIIHRLVATVALLFLIIQIVTGLRRMSLHRRLHRPLIALWLVTYLSGLTIFV